MKHGEEVKVLEREWLGKIELCNKEYEKEINLKI